VKRAALLLACAAVLAGCGTAKSPRPVPGGDADRGARLIVRYGCGSCHQIPGIHGADGRVGPSLDDLARRRLIAGKLANTPANLERWIRDPQRISPGTVMPDLGVTRPESRDIAAYLYGRT
jgi:cytochrome c2